MRNKRLIVLLTVTLVLVLVIVVCGATFLVRSVDAYSYYENAELEAYNKKVVAAAGIKRNSSMFFVDEVGVKNKIEKKYPNIGVVNIRRSFPDRVTINYVIYEKSFQYENGGKYYQCYSSGRIGEVAAEPVPGYFTLKPAGATATAVGDYFQGSGKKDRKYIDSIIKFFRSKGMIDFQINQLIKFVDLRRDGYVYIRTNAGCSIEIRDSGKAKFVDMLDRGFAIYAKTDPKNPDVLQTKGLIKVYPNMSATAKDPITSTYLKSGEVEYDGKIYTDDGYYADKYEAVGT